MPSIATYDYETAGTRHMDDALQLQAQGRLPNASQLYGYAAECALIAIAIKKGVAKEGPDGIEGPLRVHIHDLWNVLLGELRGRGVMPLYNALGTINPFREWRNRDRYTNTGCNQPDVVTKQQRGAQRVRSIYDQVRVGTL